MPTSWERMVREVARQSPGIAEKWGVPVRELQVASIAGGRVEGGWADEPGNGDGGAAWYWWQFHYRGGVGTHMVLNAGWANPLEGDTSDALDPVKNTKVALNAIARHLSKLPADHPDRMRTALYRFEKPEGYPHELAADVYVDRRWLPAVAAAEEEVEAFTHHDPTFVPGRVAPEPPDAEEDVPPEVVAEVETRNRSEAAGPAFARDLEGPPLPQRPLRLDWTSTSLRAQGGPGKRDVARNASRKGGRDVMLGLGSFGALHNLLNQYAAAELEQFEHHLTSGNADEAIAALGSLVFVFAFRYVRDARS